MIENCMVFVDKQICNKIPIEVRSQENILPLKLTSNGQIQVITCSSNQKAEKIIQSFFPGYIIDIQKTDWREIRKTSYKNYGFSIPNPLIYPKEFLNSIIMDCVALSYSDIHFEPEVDFVRVRVSANGKMLQICNFEKKAWLSILAEIKLMSGMNLTETKLPQDANVSNFTFGDLRVSTHPTIFGENIVIRILDKSSKNYNIYDLGFDIHALELITKIINKNQGLFLICGSTGSGKSTTAHSLLKYINDGSYNIMTLEDPVEHVIPGIRQTSITRDFGFAKGLRSILRQNPSIIFVGEIRDAETAKLAIDAEMSGKMVIATLHAKSCQDTIQRLKDLNIQDPRKHLSMIIFQKLVPIKCCNMLSCEKCFGSGSRSRKLYFDFMEC